MDKARAQSVLARIDEILRWEQRLDQQKDQKFAELGKHLCEVRDQRYWRLGYKSFEDFLEAKFPDSRRKAYYLMSIHDNLPQIPTQEIEGLGWSKALELAKLARNEGRRFDSATWLHRAKECTKQELKQEVYKHFTGEDYEPYEMVYFKLFDSQLPIVERALYVASRMAGTERSRGYCLELICADFLAGQPEESTPEDQGCRKMLKRAKRIKLGKQAYRQLLKRVFERDRWSCQKCGSLKNLQVHHNVHRSQLGDDALRNLVTLCAYCHLEEHGYLSYSKTAAERVLSQFVPKGARE
jgi:hypothetical protein